MRPMDEAAMSETVEQQTRDSDMIFTQISTSAIVSYEEAERLIVNLYVPDKSVSRAGISHALKRLEKFFKDLPRNNAIVDVLLPALYGACDRSNALPGHFEHCDKIIHALSSAGFLKENFA